MKPHRIRMTHNLLLNYGLYRKMEIYVCELTVTALLHLPTCFFLCVQELICPLVFQRPHKASGEEMTKYHSDDYIKFLRSIRPDNMSEYSKQMQRCEFGQRCGLCSIKQYYEQYCEYFSAVALQLMWERTVRCLMVYLSSASSREGALLVSCSFKYSDRQKSCHHRLQ